MKTPGEIIRYLEAELAEAYKQYDHWKDIDRSEAMKYRIRANMLEDVLDNIDPAGELSESEEIAKVLVSDPEEKKPKRKFLRIYLGGFYLVVFFSSLISIDLFISFLLEKFGIETSSILIMVLYIIHIISFALMFFHRDLLYTEEKNI